MMKRVLLVLLLCLLVVPAWADEGVKPTLDNLLRTFIRFGALDIKDDILLDEFAMASECELFRKFYDNDFKWNQVRAAMRESIHMNIKNFPVNFHYDTKSQLSRYDFKDKIFLLADGTPLLNVNSFGVRHKIFQCGTEKYTYMPLDFHFVLDAPISIRGLPLSEKDAQALLQRMKASGNEDRVIYTRFNLRVVYISPLMRVPVPGPVQGMFAYAQRGKISVGERPVVRLDSQLDTVDFYEDEKMTKLIYSYVVP